jgi:hypothetical protein
MKAAEVLELEEIAFIEPSFSALTDPVYTDLLADGDWDEGRLLLDEHEEPVGVAFHEPAGWIAGSFLCRPPNVAVIEQFEQVNGEIFQDDRAVWETAVREYFSGKLLREVSPAIEDLNPARHGILAKVIADAWGRGNGEPCIDCCCGSGVGSLVLREQGYSPLSYDNDTALLARGLAEHRLLSEETMCLDATIASDYIDRVPLGIGIMMGEINTFSQEMWQQIATEFFAVTSESLITVGTGTEAQLVKSWGEAAGRLVEIRESTGDPFYDHWVCIARPAKR